MTKSQFEISELIKSYVKQIKLVADAFDRDYTISSVFYKDTDLTEHDAKIRKDIKNKLYNILINLTNLYNYYDEYDD